LLRRLAGVSRWQHPAYAGHAIARRRPAALLLHHFNRGVPSIGAAYEAQLMRIDARSISNTDDNAKAEWSSNTLRPKAVQLEHYQTFVEAEANLSQFIEDITIRQRWHVSLGYPPPIACGAAHRSRRNLACTLHRNSCSCLPLQHHAMSTGWPS
jgi:hypothetical protein